MSEDSNDTKVKTKKEKKRREKKEKRPKAKKEGTFGQKVGRGFVAFFKGVGKIIKGFFKYCLFPFWYTGVLFEKTFRFLKTRSNKPLTEEDKNYLSLIPTLFFMFGLCILVLYLLFATPVFEETKKLIENESFWQSVGQWFVDLWNGFVDLLQIIFVNFFYEKIIDPFADLLQSHHWVSAFVLLIALILVIGLSILIINFAKKGKIFIFLGNLFKKIGRGIKKGHEAIKKFVLKYLVGERYVKTRPKNFFWTNVFLQFVLTLLFIVFSIYLVVEQYQAGVWDSKAIMNFAIVAAGMLFLLVGVFATWFFSLVHGVSSSAPKELKAAKE